MFAGMSTVGQKPESLEQRLEKRIARKRGDVFLREDFSDLGGYDQVGRALQKLVRKGELLKLSGMAFTPAPPGRRSLTSRCRRRGCVL
jgi:hypothetical protein